MAEKTLQERLREWDNIYVVLRECADELDRVTRERDRYLAAIVEHNDECQALCGVGEHEADACGYRKYFEAGGRRCPHCPVYAKIDVPTADPPAASP